MIQEKDIKILWGRAGGRCSYCNTDLTLELQNSDLITIGEMAHVIARKHDGPRGSEKIAEEKRNSYDNLILLCANHHKMIDKSPENFSVDEILIWKIKHEERINLLLSGETFKNSDELFQQVRSILFENKEIFQQYGPSSFVAMRNPLSDASKIWELKKVSTMIPNNTRIINIIECNLSLLSLSQKQVFYKFKQHAEAFKMNAEERIDREAVPMFPLEFEKMINREGD